MTESHPDPLGHPTDRFLGTSPAIASLRAQIRHLANFDVVGSPHVPTLLLQGETGTGKGLVARVMHDSGPRAQGPFIEVNCAAIPDTMLEAELFGFEAGAFTDAKRAKAGLFEAASAGTLFLDEIDALPLVLQGKLLTALESKRVRRLGAVTERAVDVKLIGATNAGLSEAVAAGRFRADLYHRLAVVVLALPPLRERGADILVLAQAYLQQYSTAHGLPPKRLSAGAEAWLQGYAWPGNVRELSHVMDRVTLLHVGEEINAETLAQLCLPLTAPATGGEGAVASRPLEPAEAARIRQALAQTGGNVARAARLLGVSRDTVRYRMQRYGITRLRPAASPTPVAAEPAPPAALQTPTGEAPGTVAFPAEGTPQFCPQCQHANPAEAVVCTACAAPLAVPCPTYGQDTLPGAACCPACATPVFRPRFSAPVPLPDTPEVLPRQNVTLPSVALLPREAERRYLTVLFCDLVDSANLVGHLDPEDVQEVVQAYHHTCAEVIQQFGGYVDQYIGDEVVACFGYPLAHEDDAQRAVRAGLAIVDALDALNPQLTLPSGERLAVRLAVHTGLVVVGGMGMGGGQEPLPLGQTPSIAAQLQHLAVPNTLVVSAATYRLIEGYFTCETLGAQVLKGMAQPLQVYRVLGTSGAQGRLEVAAARGLTPLVGREAEVGLLLERWGRVKAGMGQVVGLEGEAGIGKFRLVLELKDQVAREAHTCLECRGSPYSQHTAWYPIVELLQRWLQWRPGEAPDEALEKLKELSAQAQLAPDDTVPVLAELMALPLPAERYAARPLPPEQQRQRTLDTSLALMGALAEQHPVLLIVEDLHWVDPSTLELLALLIDQVPTTHIFIVLTCRPTFQPPWGFRAYLTPLVLDRLTPSQTEEAEGVRVAEAADHPYSRVLAYNGVGSRALRQGDFPEAISIFEQALDLAQMAHIRLLVPLVAAPLGAAYALAGRIAEGLTLLEQAVEQGMAMHYMLDHALRLVWLGEAYLCSGRMDEATTQAQRALEFSRVHQERSREAYALRLLGEIAVHRHPTEAEQGEALYRQALALADELGMRPLLAHCHRGLGTLYTMQGQSERAHAELSIQKRCVCSRHPRSPAPYSDGSGISMDKADIPHRASEFYEYLIP